MEEFKHLSFASSLCGKCTEVCPVKIEIHKQLLFNRRDSVNQGLSPFSEKFIWTVWKKAMLSRKLMNSGGATMKNFMLRNFFKSKWGTRRELPKVAAKSFNELWRQRGAN
jgi:L-lactate dehydrogenase complex protein LldF